VLARIPGVTVARYGSAQGFAIEGNGLQVRGLSGIQGTLNGREIFGATGGSGLSWNEVTPELMAAVDVYKDSTSDLIEGGSAGSIDLRTKMPFDFKKPSIVASLGASYGDMVKATTPSASVLATRRFDTKVGEVGVLLDVGYSDLRSQNDLMTVQQYQHTYFDGGMKFLPYEFLWSDVSYARKRLGIYEAVQWKPSDTFTAYQSFFSSTYRSHSKTAYVYAAADGNYVLPDPSGTWAFNDAGYLLSASNLIHASEGGATPYGQPTTNTSSTDNFSASGSDQYGIGKNSTAEYAQGFVWTPTDKWRVKGDLQFVDSSAHSQFIAVGDSGTFAGMGFTTNGDGIPSFTLNGTQNLHDPTKINMGTIAYQLTKNHATMGAASLDVDYDIGDGFFKSAKAGVRYADRVENDYTFGTYWAPLGNGWDGSPQYTASQGPASDFVDYGFPNFFRGDVKVPSSLIIPSQSMIRSFDYVGIMNKYGYWSSNFSSPQDEMARISTGNAAIPLSSDNIRIKTESAYGLVKFGSDTSIFGAPFVGNFGIRVVHNAVVSSGYFVDGSQEYYQTQAAADADYAALGGAAGIAAYEAAHNNTLPPFNDTKTVPSAFYNVEHFGYTRALPAVNVDFRPDGNKIHIRFAANVTMSPAGYGDLRSSGSLSVNTTQNANNTSTLSLPGIYNNVSISSGAPNIKPTMAHNFDTSFEWYPSNNFNMHVSAFYKELHDLIVYATNATAVGTLQTVTNGQTSTQQVTAFANQDTNHAKAATLDGVEIGFRKFFDELPAPYNGLGIEANGTVLSGKLPGIPYPNIDGVSTNTQGYPNLSKYSDNVVLMYEKDPWSIRLAYNWRSRSLISLASGSTGNYTSCPDTTGANCHTVNFSLPVYANAYSQWDFGASYKVNEHIRLGLSANNLTDAIYSNSNAGYPNNVYLNRDRYRSDRRIEANAFINF
jgi:TonB-dependent receptor